VTDESAGGGATERAERAATRHCRAAYAADGGANRGVVVGAEERRHPKTEGLMHPADAARRRDGDADDESVLLAPAAGGEDVPGGDGDVVDD